MPPLKKTVKAASRPPDPRERDYHEIRDNSVTIGAPEFCRPTVLCVFALGVDTKARAVLVGKAWLDKRVRPHVIVEKLARVDALGGEAWLEINPPDILVDFLRGLVTGSTSVSLHELTRLTQSTTAPIDLGVLDQETDDEPPF